MEKLYKGAAAAFGAVVSFFTGMPPLLVALLGVMSLDYATGLLCALMGVSPKTEGGALSSRAAREGLARKVMLLAVVALAALVDFAVASGAGAPFSATTGTVCLWFVAAEGISILENAAAMGLPVPKALKQALESVKEREGDPAGR